MPKLELGLTTIALLLLVACSSAATTASRNLSTAADNFEIERRIVFYNGITDSFMLVIEGRCSIHEDWGSGGRARGQLEVTCKTGENAYKKHFLGLSDNVTYVAEQVDAADVSEYHYRVIFKPQEIIPDVRIRVDPSDVPAPSIEQ